MHMFAELFLMLYIWDRFGDHFVQGGVPPHLTGCPWEPRRVIFEAPIYNVHVPLGDNI